ncbi:FKBP-type peptidyl-prolyl cis-trans isomerase [Ginsengibacter hankyongi]|uniref:Peptidyl-prolyl cis-trans isomerase n=1 Tax=Ginsengibacter hankyongi TaxID=2607284 RepID=A0A5J5IJS3_9BACT|nr:FKBP-type peptidyl-prolyl cis-trans isomerase [Ginsengibacter hankyongi]KAA9041031.1 FKBP-type peptidyl-prolyl cis-trans isomerase [Ginsengibacter hankyongi]
MKKILFILPVLFSVCYAQTKKPASKPAVKKTPAKVTLSTADSLSYAMGVQTAEYYKAQGAENINPAMVKKAYEDVYNNKKLLISPEQCNMTIQTKLQEFMAQKTNAEKEKSTKFLEENKKRPGVITLPSGLQYEIITKGTGLVPTATDTVKANYIGSLIDGKEFDNSYKRNEALTIPVGGVIRGWTEALQLMPVGSKWKLYIPSELGYGDRGAGGAIPGGAALVFTIELLDIVHNK